MRAEAIYSALLRCYPARLSRRIRRRDAAHVRRTARRRAAGRRRGSKSSRYGQARLRRGLRRAQGALPRDSSGSSIRGPDNDGAARLHCRRDHLSRSRHRRQHGHLQPVARGPAGNSPGRAKARRARDADRPGRSRDVDRPLGESNRWPACLGVVRRVRAVARQRPRIRIDHGVAEQPPALQARVGGALRNRYARAWYPGRSSRCWAAGRNWQGLYQRCRSRRYQRSSDQPCVLAAAVRRTRGRARRDPDDSTGSADDRRRRGARLRRRDQRPAT